MAKLVKWGSSIGVEKIKENDNGGFSGTILKQKSWTECRVRNQFIDPYHEVISNMG